MDLGPQLRWQMHPDRYRQVPALGLGCALRQVALEGFDAQPASAERWFQKSAFAMVNLEAA